MIPEVVVEVIIVDIARVQQLRRLSFRNDSALKWLVLPKNNDSIKNCNCNQYCVACFSNFRPVCIRMSAWKLVEAVPEESPAKPVQDNQGGRGEVV